MSYVPLSIPEKNLYVLLGDQRHGPFSMEELRAKFAKGEIVRGTYLWYPGIENWITVGDVPEFDRRDAPVPTSTPETPSEQNQFWIYDQGKVVAIVAEALRESIRANKFRRADLVFDESHNKWMRADQHPQLGHFFRPAVPPPPSQQVIAAAQAPSEAEAIEVEIVAPGESTPPALATASVKPLPMSPIAGVPGTAPTVSVEKPKTFHWVWPGVGLASVALAFVMGPKLWHRVAPEPVRAPASVAPAAPPSKLMLLLPLGIDFDAIKAYKHFNKCRLKNEHPNAGVTFRCTYLPGSLESSEFTLRNGKLVRVAGWFSKESRGAELGEFTSQFGTPEVSEPIKCDRLTEAQRSLYRSQCAKNLMIWTVWTDGNVRAMVLAANENGRPTPLEIWVEVLTK